MLPASDDDILWLGDKLDEHHREIRDLLMEIRDLLKASLSPYEVNEARRPDWAKPGGVAPGPSPNADDQS